MVNSVLSLLHDILAEVHQDLCHFYAGGIADGDEDAVALAVKQTGIHSPGHALQCQGGDVRIGGRCPHRSSPAAVAAALAGMGLRLRAGGRVCRFWLQEGKEQVNISSGQCRVK